MDNELVARDYKILKRIDSGGMAYIYRAENLETGEIVALKVLKPEFSQSEEYIRRFKKEADAVMSLVHENIVRVNRVVSEGETHFLEMEYLKGHTLKEIIKKGGALPLRKAVDIAIQICHALSYAHSKHIIHRDIKPHNIMIQDNGKAKLVDFGIALDASGVTQTFSGGNVMGSVHYFSPEQALGQNVDEKSDIYSLGIVLYEMILGKLPFSGENSVTVALKHLQEDITPPCVINTAIPVGLSDVVMKATNKKPELRYASASEMEEDLKTALERKGPLPSVGDKPALDQTMVIQTTTIQREAAKQAKEQDKSHDRRVRGRILRIIATSLLFIGLLFVLFLLGRNIVNSIRGTRLYVPRLVDKTEDEAEDIARREGFKLDRRSEPNDFIPEGVIITQDPPSGQEAAEGSTIKIVISSGKMKIPMPKLVDMQYAQAVALLKDLGLEVGTVYLQASTQPEGTVIAQEPLADVDLVPGSEVDLWVSGEDGISLPVPLVAQMPLEEAKNTIERNGLRMGLVYEEKSEYAPGTATRTAPDSGTFCPIDVPVTIFVSSYLKDYTKYVNLTFSVQEDNSLVRITYEQIPGYEFVVYENNFASGRQTMEYLVQSIDKQSKKLHIYVNGAKISTETISFE